TRRRSRTATRASEAFGLAKPTSLFAGRLDGPGPSDDPLPGLALPDEVNRPDPDAKPFGHLPGRSHPLQPPDLSDLLLGQLRQVLRGRGNHPQGPGVPLVLLGGHDFEIGDVVVAFVPVLVIYLHTRGDRSEKGFSHEAVDVEVLHPPALVEVELAVPALARGL